MSFIKAQRAKSSVENRISERAKSSVEKPELVGIAEYEAPPPASFHVKAMSNAKHPIQSISQSIEGGGYFVQKRVEPWLFMA